MTDLNIDETITLLQELIRNECVNPPGNELLSIKSIEKFLSKKGISCKIFQSSENRGNLIARIKGSANGPSMMFGPSHVDVVPIEKPDEWIIPPFSGENKDGFIWGRGSFDMLFMVAAQCQAFAILHKEKFKPKGDLILAIVADEEVGGKYGCKWMVDNHPEEMKVDNAVSEFGGLEISENKLILPYAEKGVIGLRLTFKGQSGHASMPYGKDNSVEKLSEAIIRINKYKMPYTTKYLKHLAKGLGVGFIQRMLLSRKLLLPLALKILQKTNPVMAGKLHSMSRTTLATTIIRGGQKINVLPGSSSVDIDCRLLPEQDFNYAKKHILKALGKKLAKEVEIIIIGNSLDVAGSESPLDTEFVDAIKRTYQKLIPNSSIVPVISYGATDLRFIRRNGGNGYGFCLFESGEDISDLAHNINEKIGIKTVELTTKAMYELAKEYLG